MNCDQCHIDMQHDDLAGYFHCLQCGMLVFDDELEPPEDLVETPEPIEVESAAHCPLCGTLMTRAALQELRVDHCAECRGILMRNEDFGVLVQALRQRATGPPDEPKPLDQSQLDRMIDCPRCRETMNVHPYYGPGNIVIDSCRPCGLVWLDGGELERVINAPGAGRGDEP